MKSGNKNIVSKKKKFSERAEQKTRQNDWKVKWNIKINIRKLLKMQHRKYEKVKIHGGYSNSQHI